MSANAATSDFGDYAPAAHTDEDDLGVGSPHATTSSSSSSSSRTSFSVENSPTTGRISGDETLPATASGLCRHFCSLHSSVMCVHVVSVFAAIHINHLLKTLVSPDDDNHGKCRRRHQYQYLMVPHSFSIKTPIQKYPPSAKPTRAPTFLPPAPPTRA